MFVWGPRRRLLKGDVQICANRCDDLSSLVRVGLWRRHRLRMAVGPGCWVRVSRRDVMEALSRWSMQMLSAWASRSSGDLRAAAMIEYVR
jgi:hypothetical protein